jgi:Predicted hydrolase of the alpha/beta superfamily
MEEERVTIINNKLLIEGLLEKSSGDRGVVICHPHPRMGGSMHNNVVEAIREAFAAEKYSTLRFNFRGVGLSTGVYDEGRGEQEDILAACKYLHNTGILQLSFAGYSFGSWVGSKIMEKDDNPFTICIFVSPPINYFDFNFAKLTNKINLIVCGNEDQFCDFKLLKEQIRNIDTDLRIISHTDHFYSGKEKELINILRLSIKKGKI